MLKGFVLEFNVNALPEEAKWSNLGHDLEGRPLQLMQRGREVLMSPAKKGSHDL